MTTPTPIKAPPAVPPPLNLLTVTWAVDEPIYRGHGDRAGNLFNPGYGGPTRFAFFDPIDPGGIKPVGVLYGGATEPVAIAECLFHNLPFDAGAHLAYADLVDRYCTRLLPRRPLKLARLHDSGLRRLHVTNQELIGSLPSHYGETVEWARALHGSDDTLDGLQWMSRQYNSEKALMLFADRVDEADLAIDPDFDRVPWFKGPGLDNVLDQAEAADITLGIPTP